MGKWSVLLLDATVLTWTPQNEEKIMDLDVVRSTQQPRPLELSVRWLGNQLNLIQLTTVQPTSPAAVQRQWVAEVQEKGREDAPQGIGREVVTQISTSRKTFWTLSSLRRFWLELSQPAVDPSWTSWWEDEELNWWVAAVQRKLLSKEL